jgi:hypothetical protein
MGDRGNCLCRTVRGGVETDWDEELMGPIPGDVTMLEQQTESIRSLPMG